MTLLYNSTAVLQLEQLAMDQGFEPYALMQEAGAGAFEVLQEQWPDAKHLIICCGMGNNGGDGFVLARLAKEAGLTVNVYLVGGAQPKQIPATETFNDCIAAGVSVEGFRPELDLEADVLVDALLGLGLEDSVREAYASAIHAINEAGVPVLSVDLPSGLSADTGRVLGIAVQATCTVTFIALKQGLFTSQGPSLAGAIFYDTLGFADDLMHAVSSTAKLLDWNLARPLLPLRRRDAHKGDYGHVLVVGGDYGMGGAVRMAAEAAMRSGAGLVTVATRPEHVSVVSGSRPELMCHQVEAPEDLDPLLARATVIVVGPGLGTSDWSRMLLDRLLQSDLPKVLDADALNLLAESPRASDHWILTPHPGEAGRLLDQPCQTIQDDRFSAVRALQKRYGGVAVLKGVGTLIKDAEALIHLCPAGNPGMASGGMGDILAGLLGGLLAQKLSLSAAAEAGVLIHSLAADRAAELGGERGLLATDLLAQIRYWVNPSQVSNADD